MKDVRNDELIRLSMKPVLSPDDEARLEAFLATHPDARATWEEERALGRALQSLPDVPVSSNFTARVMQEIDLENAREERASRPRPWWLRGFWPRLSWATIAVVLGFSFLHQFRVSRQSQFAHDVATVSQDLSILPNPEELRDFDEINSLRQVQPPSDDLLLIALQ